MDTDDEEVPGTPGAYGVIAETPSPEIRRRSPEAWMRRVRPRVSEGRRLIRGVGRSVIRRIEDARNTERLANAALGHRTGLAQERRQIMDFYNDIVDAGNPQGALQAAAWYNPDLAANAARNRSYNRQIQIYRTGIPGTRENYRLFQQLIFPHVPGFRYIPGFRGYQECKDEFYLNAYKQKFM